MRISDDIRQTLTIGEADIELARRLRLHVSAPIAELRRVIRDGNGTIIYFGHLFFRGDLVRLDFAVDLKRIPVADRPDHADWASSSIPSL